MTVGENPQRRGRPCRQTRLSRDDAVSNGAEGIAASDLRPFDPAGFQKSGADEPLDVRVSSSFRRRNVRRVRTARLHRTVDDHDRVTRGTAEEPDTQVGAVIDRLGPSLYATAGPAGQALGRARIPETAAATLADRVPPAWVYLHGLKSPLSSTASLRQWSLWK